MFKQKIQAAIDEEVLDSSELNDAKILKRNYQKILKKKNYSLRLKPNHKYSNEIVELIYKLNLPISIVWDEKKQIIGKIINFRMPISFFEAVQDHKKIGKLIKSARIKNGQLPPGK